MATSVKPVRHRFRRPSGFSVFGISLMVTACAAALLLAAATALAASGPAAAAAPSGDCAAQLSVSSAAPSWATYEDYLNRDLTVEQSIQNLAACPSCELRIDDVLASNGVETITPMPMPLAPMEIAETRNITLTFHVPAGVAKFYSRLVTSCTEAEASQPLPGSSITIDPELAYANEGCPEGPVPGQDGRALPLEQNYGYRRFTVTLLEPDGSPAAGKAVKWDMSDQTMFRMLGATEVTDSSGQAYVDVTPPQFFICVTPYFDHGQTQVMARSAYGQAEASFLYTRCAPPGETPPWAAETT